MRTSAIKSVFGPKFRALCTLAILCLVLAACGSSGGGGGGAIFFTTPVAVSPATATVATGASFPFTINSNDEVVWKVNGVTGGDATNGLIDPTGVYTAPAAVPTPAAVTISAVRKSDQAVLGTAKATVVQFAGYAGIFQNLSSMKNARSNHTAVLLPITASSAVPTGYILVAGGFGASGLPTGKAELFNPAARAFGHFTSITASMKAPRAYHTATRLQNGLILIAGGIDDTNAPLATAEIYDPARKSFTATGSMATGRWMHSATLLGNGKVLIAGGTADPGPGTEGDTALASAELYDPATGTFSPVSPGMITPRYFHTATLLRDGKVLLAGGQGTGGQILPLSELYDPAGKSFAAAGSMLVDPASDTGRWQQTATMLNDAGGSVVMIGGNAGTIAGPGANHLFSAQTFDPLAATFTSSTATTNQLTDARSNHAAALLATGDVLLTGGLGGPSSNLSDFLLTAELYTPAGAGSFAVTSTVMNFARANHTATALANGQVVIIGGNNGGTFLNSAEVYR
ncbi:MAG TPA: kelch repeat-containing protein [Geomonas sp.]|nr:kelch repeat-containing protein [Geomonas sp.]